MSEGDKPELNPYKSPREAEPLTREQVVKRAVGVGALILLTPPAMIIAVLCCCSGGIWLGDYYGVVIAYGGPFVVLIALMATGIVLDRSHKRTIGFGGSRTGLFVATPFVVAGATVVGFFSAAAAYDELVTMIAIFLTLPTLALLFMLWLIWQAK